MRSKFLIMAVLLGFLAGCGGDESEASASPDELATLLADTRADLEDAESLDVGISTARLPDGVSGLLSASGVANRTPAFKGSGTISYRGASIDSEVVAIGDKVYANPFGGWMELDVERYNFPNPATLFGAEGDGILSILTSTEGLEEGERERSGDVILRQISGTVPGEIIATFIPTANAKVDYDVRYEFTDKDELEDVSISGPFYGGSRFVTYTVRLQALDSPATIEPPN